MGEVKNDVLMNMEGRQKIAQLQCMYMGKDVPDEIMGYFKNGFGAIASLIDMESKEEVLKEAEREQKLVMENSGIPALRHAEALTGLLASEATVFPSAIGLGAAWNPQLVYEMADIIRKQMVSVGLRHALSPVMDVARDPRWGRTGETYGEDPTLCAALSVAFTKGLQGDDLKEGVAATGKHFLGYAMSQGGLNMAANAISPRELREVYAKPFQAAITEGNLQGIMNSYGVIDNELVIDSYEILTELLRKEMGFRGIVVSDYMSINRMLDLKVSDSASDAGRRALEAGLDMEMPTPFGYTDDMLQMVKSGEFEERLDESVKRVLGLKEKLGLWECPAGKKELLQEAYDDPKNTALSLKAARESIVLLKNDGILPLKSDISKIAVIGPHAGSIRNLFGCYTFAAQVDRNMSGSMADMPGMAGIADQMGKSAYQMPYLEGSMVRGTSEEVENVLKGIYGKKTPTIVESLRSRWSNGNVTYAKGCDIAGTDQSGFGEAIRIAKQAEVAILTLGGKYGWGTNCTTGEGIDCDKVGLTGVQEKLLAEICETGTPVVLVHMDAKPLTSVYAEEHCAAILEIWFPGETGGQALADVLSGDYNPGGKLPITAVRSEGQIPLFHAAQNGSGYYDEKGMVISKYVENTKLPLHYFGEGMSYTSFAYSDLEIDKSAEAQGKISVSVRITNTGERNGEEVVQLYVTDEVASMVRPAQELAGFYRVALKPGQTKKICFEMKISQFAFLDKEMKWTVEAGDMTVKIGASSRDIRISHTFKIENTMVIDGKTRGFYARAWEE